MTFQIFFREDAEEKLSAAKAEHKLSYLSFIHRRAIFFLTQLHDRHTLFFRVFLKNMETLFTLARRFFVIDLEGTALHEVRHQVIHENHMRLLRDDHAGDFRFDGFFVLLDGFNARQSLFLYHLIRQYMRLSFS